MKARRTHHMNNRPKVNSPNFGAVFGVNVLNRLAEKLEASLRQAPTEPERADRPHTPVTDDGED